MLLASVIMHEERMIRGHLALPLRTSDWKRSTVCDDEPLF